MVTKRARRWLQRGMAAGIALAVLGLAVATWFTSEAIEADLLLMPAEAPQVDPGDVGLVFTLVDVPGPLGNYPAWLIAPDEDSIEDTWAVFVHGVDGDRGRALPVVPTFLEHGLTSLVVTYRGDADAPPAEGGHHSLGSDEWEDVEAAVVLALESGARDVVLVGYGSGGSVTLTFLRQSVWSERVSGVILDSAYLDPGSMVDVRTAADNVPGFLAGWGKAMATFRFGVDWASLDQVAAADAFTTPILLIHGGDDRKVPVRVADAFAEARPDLIRYVRLEGVGHLDGYAADPGYYTGTVGHFLRRVAVGPSVLPEPVSDTGAE